MRRLLKVISLLSGVLMVADAFASTQIGSILVPVKQEINELIIFVVSGVWIIGGLCGGGLWFKGNFLMGGMIGILAPSIITTLLLAHKYII